ncbi:MAG: hypothetical protein WA902_06980 [Thermosynechococcaceae cyanobacterium]
MKQDLEVLLEGPVDVVRLHQYLHPIGANHTSLNRSNCSSPQTRPLFNVALQN